MSRISVAIVALLLSSAVSAADYHCQPAAKHYCNAERCATETEGFQHAESFFYHSDGPALGACLWTNCYRGKVSRFVSPDGEQTTVIGQLAPEHSPDMYPPMLISLTLDNKMAFTAIWHFSGDSLTIDQGKCEPQK